MSITRGVELVGCCLQTVEISAPSPQRRPHDHRLLRHIIYFPVATAHASGGKIEAARAGNQMMAATTGTGVRGTFPRFHSQTQPRIMLPTVLLEGA
jgi:hypothetical protein